LRRWLLRLGALSVVGVLVLQASRYLDELITTDPIYGWPLTVLTVIVAISAVSLFGRELLDLHRLQRRATVRAAAERLTRSELHGEAEPLLLAVRGELRPAYGLREGLQNYDRHASDALDDGERLRLFERNVLAPVDRRAYGLVVESSRDIGLLTALSPFGLLDGVLVLWRTTLMLRAVARLYGVAPGPSTTLSLLRRCLRNAALAGLADIMTHAALEHAGASIAAMLSARAGQGAGNALLSARLGIQAIKLTRPLPFVAEEEPRLRHIRRALFEGDGKELRLRMGPIDDRRSGL
jgi:putative membrane protein